MSLRDQLQAVYDSHGKLTPALVVDAARPVDAPLHDRFEWDDRIGGEAWRRHQAHEMIRAVRVEYRKSDDAAPTTVRQYHAVRTEGGGDEYVYEPAEKVAADPLLRQLVLRDMQREWQTLKARYEAFTEFAEMIRGDLDAA